MKIKEGTVLPDKIEMRKVLKEAERIWGELGAELWVTSGMESTRTHSAGSYHPYGYAVDLGVRGMTDDAAQSAAVRLAGALPADYDVVYERDHVHVEFDYDRARRRVGGTWS